MEYILVTVAVLGLANTLALKIMHRRDMAQYGIRAKWYL